LTSLPPESMEFVLSQLRRLYSETVVDHAVNPRNLGALDNPDGYTRYTGSCGDTLEIWLRVNDDAITDAAFITDGCSATVASGSMITEMVKNKSVADAQAISQQEVLEALGGLPEANEHCALLAATALREAILDYLAMKREPWKKAYRRY
jgi:nitrogen fixation NifU-like protein